MRLPAISFWSWSFEEYGKGCRRHAVSEGITPYFEPQLNQGPAFMLLHRGLSRVSESPWRVGKVGGKHFNIRKILIFIYEWIIFLSSDSHVRMLEECVQETIHEHNKLAANSDQ